MAYIKLKTYFYIIQLCQNEIDPDYFQSQI
jgi:hypothetical protein